MQLFGGSDRGMVRSQNQDSFELFSKDGAWFMIVADGLGGHLGGKRASSLACEVIRKRIEAEYKEGLSQAGAEELLRQSLNEANSVIWHYSVKEPENRGMGTTIVLAMLRDNTYTVVNLGDSRAYMISGGEITQITKDQSYVQSLIDKGELTAEQAKNYPGKSIILQAAGLGDDILPDIYRGDMGECVLLCSDGLTNELADEKILEIITENEAENTADILIEEAKRSGGLDNITAALAFAKGV